MILRPLLVALATATVTATDAPPHAGASTPSADPEVLFDQFEDEWSAWLDRELAVHVEVNFDSTFGAIAVDDGSSDQQPLDEASRGFATDQIDVLSMLAFETAPLDGTVSSQLFDPESGLLASTFPGVHHVSGVTLDPVAFAPGMRVVVIFPAAPRAPISAPGTGFTAAVEWVNPAYGQGPPQGTFAGFPQIDRYDVGADVELLRYFQFVDNTYGSFRSATALLDTCSGPQPLDPCFYAFFIGLGRAERDGVTSVQVELFATDGTFGAADRLGPEFGTPADLSALTPVTLSITTNVAEPTTTMAPSTTVAATTTVAPAAAAPTTTAASTTTSAPATQAPVAAAAEPETPVLQAAPVVTSASDGSAPIGGIVAVVGGIVAMIAGAGLIIVGRKREAADEAAGVDVAANPPPPAQPASIFSYAMPEAVDTSADTMWSRLLTRNADVEGRVYAAGTNLSETMLPPFLALASAVEDFAKPYDRAVSGMVMLTEHQNEQEVQVARAKVADLVTALVSLGVLLKRAGMRAVRWWRTDPSDLANITDEVAELLRAAEADAMRANAPVGHFVLNLRPPVIAPKPSWFNPPTGFAKPWGEGGVGEDLLFWEMDMMALETGDNLAALVTRSTVGEALEILRVNVARNRGVNVVPTTDALRLERLVIQARLSERGEQYAFRVDDLQWLMSRRDPAARQGLATAVSEAEVAAAADGASIPVVLSPDDYRLVEGVMDRPGLADAITDATTAAGIEVDGTGYFHAVIDPPGGTDLTATGAFDAVLDVPSTNSSIAATADGALVYIPPASVPQRLIAVDGASAVAESIVTANGTGVIAGPGAANVIASLPSDTPLLITTSSTSMFAETVGGMLGDPVMIQLLNPGTGAVTIFGQGVANAPHGTELVLTAAGFAYVDATQPMVATPDAPLPSGMAAGTVGDAEPPIIPLGSADERWFDPAWLVAQRQLVASQGEALAGVVDLHDFSQTLFDSTWFEEDFTFFGLTLEGGSTPASTAWIILSLGTSPYESLVRMEYGYLGAQQALNYLETHKVDYQQMHADVTASISALEQLQFALPAAIALLRDERNALDTMLSEVDQFAAENPDWARNDAEAIDAKVARDLSTIEQLDDSLTALQQLTDLLGNLVPWVRQLVVAPDGSAVSPLTLVNPTSLVRLASALIALSDAYGRVFLLAPPRDE